MLPLAYHASEQEDRISTSLAAVIGGCMSVGLCYTGGVFQRKCTNAADLPHAPRWGETIVRVCCPGEKLYRKPSYSRNGPAIQWIFVVVCARAGRTESQYIIYHTCISIGTKHMRSELRYDTTYNQRRHIKSP